MSCDPRFMSTLFIGCGLLIGMPANFRPAYAQGAQIEAEADWRVLRERRVYDLNGTWIGKVDGVSVRDEQIIVSVRLKARYRGTQLVIPLSQVSDTGGRLTIRALVAGRQR